jgi:hypothetical protein
MALAKKTIAILVLIPIALVLAFGGYLGVRYWWYRGYSKGTRTGTVRKVSIKGPPYCKYLSGELVVQGNALQPELWEFSVDDDAETNPIVKDLQAAEKNGNKVTLHYRQDLHSLYRCTPSEYFVTKVEK